MAHPSILPDIPIDIYLNKQTNQHAYMAQNSSHIEMYKMKIKFSFSSTFDSLPKGNYY